MTTTKQLAPEALLLIENAAAFAQSAVRLCASFGDDEYDLSPSYHNVVLYLLYLSIELCCKAWLSANGRSYERNHDLATLLSQYAAASPPVKLELPREFQSNAPQSLDLFRDHPAIWHEVRHTQYKYATDRTGGNFPASQGIPFSDRAPAIEATVHAITGVQLAIWRLCR